MGSGLGVGVEIGVGEGIGAAVAVAVGSGVEAPGECPMQAAANTSVPTIEISKTAVPA